MGQMIDVIELSMNMQECISECRSLSKWHKMAFPRKTSPNAMKLDDPSPFPYRKCLWQISLWMASVNQLFLRNVLSSVHGCSGCGLLLPCSRLLLLWLQLHHSYQLELSMIRHHACNLITIHMFQWNRFIEHPYLFPCNSWLMGQPNMYNITLYVYPSPTRNKKKEEASRYQPLSLSVTRCDQKTQKAMENDTSICMQYLATLNLFWEPMH